MSELRQDIFTGEWIIFAENRNERPSDFSSKPSENSKKHDDKAYDKECAFCLNNEKMTPKAIYQNDADGKWSIRVFSNMYPAVSPEKNAVNKNSFYNNENGYGYHEVLVDTPYHNEAVHDFSKEHLFEILKVLKDRYAKLKKDKNIKYIQIFKNCGSKAGASLVHSHWQIVALTVVPSEQKMHMEKSEKYYSEKNKNIFSDIIAFEKNEKLRIISENKYFIAFAPFASKLSYEVWIVSKEEIPSYQGLSFKKLELLADILKTILDKIKNLTDDICYNICFQDIPTDIDLSIKYYNWYLRVIPRMGNPAGFEFGTASYLNPVLPENAALYFRKK